MIKKHWILIVVIILILAAAGGVYYKLSNRNEVTTEETINPRMLVEARPGSLEKTIAATGFIAPIAEKSLSFPSRSGSTRIKKIYVEEGDRVEEGQLLMELDKTDARLNKIKAENEYNRTRINGSETAIEEARLNLELAAEVLENMDLKAPFAGLITDIPVEEGSYYTNGTATTIIDDSRLEVEVSIEESNIPDVKLGQRVSITMPSLPGKTISGRVEEIGNQAVNNSSMVTLPVTVLLDKGDYDVKLGCSADLDIIIGEVNDKIVIPITAVVNQNGREFVMKVVDGQSSPVPVKTGLSDGLKIAIESGLQPGDQILVNTFQSSALGADSRQNGFMTGTRAFRMGGGH